MVYIDFRLQRRRRSNIGFMEESPVPKRKFLVRLKHPDRAPENDCKNGSGYRLLKTAVQKTVEAINTNTAEEKIKALNIKCDLCSAPFEIYETALIK